MNIEVAARQPIPPSTVDRLRTDFAPEIARLSTLLDRDLNQLWLG